jgi:hypothetical protein
VGGHASKLVPEGHEGETEMDVQLIDFADPSEIRTFAKDGAAWAT